MPEKKYPIFSNETYSDKFRLAFSHMGSISVDCTACGRTHFTEVHLSDYEEGEYDRLKQAEAEDPEGHVAHNDDSHISYAEFGEKTFVFDCPCNFAGALEQSLWEKRSDIMTYFRDRIEEETSTSQRKAQREKDDMLSTVKAVHGE